MRAGGPSAILSRPLPSPGGTLASLALHGGIFASLALILQPSLRPPGVASEGPVLVLVLDQALAGPGASVEEHSGSDRKGASAETAAAVEEEAAAAAEAAIVLSPSESEPSPASPVAEAAAPLADATSLAGEPPQAPAGRHGGVLAAPADEPRDPTPVPEELAEGQLLGQDPAQAISEAATPRAARELVAADDPPLAVLPARAASLPLPPPDPPVLQGPARASSASSARPAQSRRPATQPSLDGPVSGHAEATGGESREGVLDAGALATPVSSASAPLLSAHPGFRRPPTPPVYPRPAVLRGIEGTVLIRVLIGADGEPLEVRVHRSSGSELLDHAAYEAVRRWAFRPAIVAGRPQPAWVEVPVRFELR